MPHASPGADLLAQVDLDAIDARLSALPTSALLTELEAIVTAIDNADPVRRKRRAGFFGRLLGRDLVAATTFDAADRRVRVHLDGAQTLATALAEQVTAIAHVAAQLRAGSAGLRAVFADASQGPDAPAALAQRMQHLAAVAATWDTAAVQIDLAREHGTQLLARHQQVRDLLVPAWRRRVSLAGDAWRGDDEVVAGLQDALRAQLTALNEALHPSSNSTDTGPVSKEPSP